MERLYCPECGNYLEGGDGSMNDCYCGWKQERYIESDDDELETLRAKVAQLEAALREALEQLEAIRLAVEPYDDIKPRDWKSDRSNLRDAHQYAKEAIATINEALK